MYEHSLNELHEEFTEPKEETQRLQCHILSTQQKVTLNYCLEK